MKQGRSSDEAMREVGRHEGHASGMTGALQVVDEGLPLVFQIEKVGLAHPPRKSSEVEQAVVHALDGIDTNPALPGVAPFLAHHLGVHCGGCHDKHQELSCFECLRDLSPPVLAALHAGTILPDSDLGFVCLQALAEARCKSLAVAPGV